MKKILVVCLAALVFGAVELKASDPVGIYAVIEKVVFEPNENAPQRIQIWGAFSFAQGDRGNDYEKAQVGYLYYSVTPGKEEICKKEWADLKSLVGKRQGVAFATRYNPKGRIRKPNDKPENPDVYPVSFGLAKVAARTDVIAPLIEALGPRK